MLLACIGSYLKQVLRYKLFILDTYHPDTVYLREQGYEDPWLFFEAKMGSASKKNKGTTGLDDPFSISEARYFECSDILLISPAQNSGAVLWNCVEFCSLVPVSLCPPQIPHGHPGSNPSLRAERPATNRLSRGKAYVVTSWNYFILKKVDQRSSGDNENYSKAVGCLLMA